MKEIADLDDADFEQPLARPARVPVFEPAPAVAEDAEAPALEIRRLGACVAIVADGVFLGGLFAVHALVRFAHPELFTFGHYFLDARWGALGTLALLTSGFTAALAVRAARLGRRRGLALSLAATSGFAVLFLCMQASEYSSASERRLLPGSAFLPVEPLWRTAAFRREHPASARYAARFRPGDPSGGEPFRPEEAERTVLPTEELRVRVLGPLVRAGVLGPAAVFPRAPSEPRNAHVFFGLYFLTTGVHAIHVAVGALAFLVLLVSSRRRRPPRAPAGQSRFARRQVERGGVETAALCWNLVLVARVFLFPLFYLVH